MCASLRLYPAYNFPAAMRAVCWATCAGLSVALTSDAHLSAVPRRPCTELSCACAGLSGRETACVSGSVPDSEAGPVLGGRLRNEENGELRGPAAARAPSSSSSSSSSYCLRCRENAEGQAVVAVEDGALPASVGWCQGTAAGLQECTVVSAASMQECPQAKAAG